MKALRFALLLLCLVVCPISAGEEKYDFVFVVSNQSFSTPIVDIKVAIDGSVIVDQDFKVRKQPNWIEFSTKLSKGAHTLNIESEKGNASLQMEIFVPGNCFGSVFYHHDPKKAREFYILKSFFVDFSNLPLVSKSSGLTKE